MAALHSFDGCAMKDHARSIVPRVVPNIKKSDHTVPFIKAKIVYSNELPESRFSLDIRHFLSFPELQVGIPTNHSTSIQEVIPWSTISNCICSVPNRV